jgi:enoyl-CoA hydratase
LSESGFNLDYPMSYSFIALNLEPGGIAQVTINRPEKRNALSGAMVAELADAFDHVAEDVSVRGLILTGAGDKAFVAGADIQELKALTPLDARTYAARGQEAFRKLETLGKPSVAAINGFALGGGLELAMACTVRFASEDAKLGQPEVKLGLIPGYGGTQRLMHLVGRGHALELLLSGDPIDAAEAYRIGLVNAVVPRERLLEFSREWLGKVLRNAPAAVALVMEAVDLGQNAGIGEGQRFEAAAFGLAAATKDCIEGTTAFLEKRRPVFEGK